MFTVTKWMAAPLLAAGLLLTADAPSAEAQFGLYGGGIHFGHGIHRGYRPSYSPGIRYGHSWGLPTPYRSRYRGHYDWHPTEIYRHGNHYHVQPGHWDYHRGPHHRHH